MKYPVARLRGSLLITTFSRIKEKRSRDIHLAELLKGSGTAFVLRVLGLGFGYVFTLLITRGYGAEAMFILVHFFIMSGE